MGLLRPVLPCLPRPDDDIQRVHGYSPARFLVGGCLVSSLLLATRTVLQACILARRLYHLFILSLYYGQRK